MLLLDIRDGSQRGSLASHVNLMGHLANGIGFMTSYGDTWLGNLAYRLVMEELDRRNAVVFVHPTAANCCRGLNYAVGVGPGSMEYGTDTTRAITGIVVNGYAHSFPNIRWIWSHGGGSMPFLAGRIGGSRQNEQMPNGFMYELQRFYYDLAGAARRHHGGVRPAPPRTKHVHRGRPALDRARERGEAPAAVRGLEGLSPEGR